VRELRKANEILKLASAFFAQAELDRRIKCERLRRSTPPAAWGRADLQSLADRPVGYRRHAARKRNPALLPPRAQRDGVLTPQVQRVWDSNLQVYGADKVWRQLRREQACSLRAAPSSA
jgi:hypothetical protein